MSKAKRKKQLRALRKDHDDLLRSVVKIRDALTTAMQAHNLLSAVVGHIHGKVCPDAKAESERSVN